MILETLRLVLRELEFEDLDALQSWQSDAHTMRFYGAPFPREKSQNCIELSRQSYEKNGFGLWAACMKPSLDVVGLVGITLQLVDGEEIPEIGYQLHRNHWGQGLATEAAAGCRDHGFSKWQFPRIISWMAPDNTPSRRVAERIGMTVWKEAVNTKSETLHVVYSIDHPVG